MIEYQFTDPEMEGAVVFAKQQGITVALREHDRGPFLSCEGTKKGRFLGILFDLERKGEKTESELVYLGIAYILGH